MTAKIYIDGYIWDDQSDYAPDYGVYSSRTARNDFSRIPSDTTELILNIHSPGGMVWEGFAIHDFFVEQCKKNNITLKTRVVGFCGSIATVIAMAAKPENRYMTENSTFYVHPPQGGTYGDADEIEKYAHEMRKEEERAIEFYISKTLLNREQVLEIMKPESFLDSKEVVEYGFFQEENIIRTNIINLKKVNKSFTNTRVKMSNKKDEESEILKAINKGFSDLTAAFRPKPKALMLTDADSNKVEVSTDKDMPSEGDEVLVNGEKPEDGDLIMSSGDVLHLSNGKIESITLKDEEITNLRKEKTELSTKVNKLEQSNIELTAKLEGYAGMEEKINALQENIAKLNSLSSEEVVNDSSGQNFSQARTGSKGVKTSLRDQIEAKKELIKK